jgi:hypothetical protein
MSQSQICNLSHKRKAFALVLVLSIAMLMFLPLCVDPILLYRDLDLLHMCILSVSPIASCALNIHRGETLTFNISVVSGYESSLGLRTRYFESANDNKTYSYFYEFPEGNSSIPQNSLFSYAFTHPLLSTAPKTDPPSCPDRDSTTLTVKIADNAPFGKYSLYIFGSINRNANDGTIRFNTDLPPIVVSEAPTYS